MCNSDESRVINGLSEKCRQDRLSRRRWRGELRVQSERGQCVAHSRARYYLVHSPLDCIDHAHHVPSPVTWSVGWTLMLRRTRTSAHSPQLKHGSLRALGTCSVACRDDCCCRHVAKSARSRAIAGESPCDCLQVLSRHRFPGEQIARSLGEQCSVCRQNG